MNEELRATLEAVRSGTLSVDEAALRLKKAPFEDLGYAKVDLHRAVRQGAAEVIYGAGKTPAQIAGIAARMRERGVEPILITRLSPEAAAEVEQTVPLDYRAEAKLGIDGNGMLSGKPVKVGAILDGPNDYITKTLNTFDAPEVPVPANVTTKVKGDRYCVAVAAAAVIAKVTRDRLMVELGAQPQYEPYEWAHNKGYGSAAHRDAIAEFGPSDLHRLSWHLV